MSADEETRARETSTRETSAKETRDDRRRISRLFLEAAALEEQEREAFLRDLEAQHPRIATQVRERLQAAEEALESDFLEDAAIDVLTRTPSAPDEDLDASDVSGSLAVPPEERYEIGRLLGAGGMGRVVEAFDRQLDRKVALKFLTHPDPAVLGMFLREARSQARVRHDHVLDIYDSGDFAGKPFIAMRNVEGRNLDERREDLSTENLVRLLIQAAEGLHAAHREGLLHHDVKPANILVEENRDGELVAFVTDFGLAAPAEQGAGIAGTPAFIAPERLRQTEVDRRSDVYSLGVTMYRLFTGELPFQAGGMLGLFHKILSEDPPPRPREHRPHLPAEIEAIILRSMAQDPEQRYASARAVAEDLRRYLDGEVVEAYAASVAYRVTRFAMRNRMLTIMAGVALFALIAGSVGVTIFAIRADVARQQAQQRQAQAESLIDFMVDDLQEKLKTLGRLDILDDAAAEAAQYFAAVPEDELSEEELLRRSQMLYQLGELRVLQGKMAEAEEPMRQSLELAERLWELNPEDPERLFSLGQSYFWVGYIRWNQRDLDGALKPLQEYLAVSGRLVEEHPERSDFRLELAYADSNLGMLFEARGDLNQALQFLQSAEETAEALVASDPENTKLQSELITIVGQKARLLKALGRLQEARRRFEWEIALRRQLIADQPNDARLHRPLGIRNIQLGLLLFSSGELEAGRRHFEEAQQILSGLSEKDPENDDLRYQLAWLELYFGWFDYLRGDPETAAASWRRNLNISAASLRRDPTKTAWRQTESVLQYHLALEEASRAPEAARERVRRAAEDLASTAESPRIRRWLSASYLLLGRLESTEEARHEAYRKAQETVEQDAKISQNLDLLAPWAESLLRQGQNDQARPAIKILRETNYLGLGFDELCRRERIACPPAKAP